MTRSARTALVIVVAAIAAVVLYAVVGGGSSKTSTAGTPTTQPLAKLVTTTSLSGAAAEVRDLLAKGAGNDRHAVYESTDAEGTTRLESWRKGGQARYETHITGTDGSTTDQVLLALKDKTVTCARKGTKDFVCTAAPISGADPFTQLAATLQGRDVTTSDDEVGGRKVRCFALTSQEGAAVSLCATPDGVPVRLQSGDTKLELTTLDSDVGDVSFDPPAPVGATPANTPSSSSS